MSITLNMGSQSAEASYSIVDKFNMIYKGNVRFGEPYHVIRGTDVASQHTSSAWNIPDVKDITPEGVMT